MLYRLARWRGSDERWPEDKKAESDPPVAESDAGTGPAEGKSEIYVYVAGRPHTDERIRLFGQPDARFAE